MYTNLPVFFKYETLAVDTVTSVLNKAKENLGKRQTLSQLATTRSTLTIDTKVSLDDLQDPLVNSGLKLIADAITRWCLKDSFHYCIKYRESNRDETRNFLYFEAIFSQPTPAFPIPQATASVFFKLCQQYYHDNLFPELVYRLEGHHSDYDIRYVKLRPEWLLSIIEMKVKVFSRIEKLRYF